MIRFQIATPEKVVYRDEIQKVSLPTELGQITVLSKHTPLVANLTPGEMIIYKKNGELEFYSLSGGFVEIKAKSDVTVLADAAEHIEEIDEQRAEEARARAKKLLEGVKADDVRFAKASAALERSLMRLRLAKRKRHHTGLGK